MEAPLAGEVLSIVMFAAVIAALMMGYPVAFTLAGVGFGFGLLGHFLGVFDLTYFNALPLRYWGVLTNDVLIAVPLFVFMGVMLERSGIAEDLLKTLGELFGRLRGGLAYSVILVGSLLAASTGIVGATVTTMGLISLPVMLQAGSSAPPGRSPSSFRHRPCWSSWPSSCRRRTARCSSRRATSRRKPCR
jgi:TRAP-type mannitol/chloroaromatic compound transport system permease large subunit